MVSAYAALVKSLWLDDQKRMDPSHFKSVSWSLEAVMASLMKIIFFPISFSFHFWCSLWTNLLPNSKAGSSMTHRSFWLSSLTVYMRTLIE